MWLKDIKIILILISVFMLSACQTTKLKEWTSEDLLINDKASLTFPQQITAKEAQADISFLLFSLSHAYGGRNYAPEGTFAKTIEALKNVSTETSIEQFHQQIDESLFLTPDNHLRAFYKGNVSKTRQALQKIGGVGANNISNPEKIWEVRTDLVEKKKVLYVSIIKFQDKENPIWKGFPHAVATRLYSADAVVIDLRGNIGGDDTKGMGLNKVLYGRPFENPIKNQYRSQTPESLALLVNRFKIDMFNLKNEGYQIPDYMLTKTEVAKDQYSKSIRGSIPPESLRNDLSVGNRLEPITGFQRPIYVLMDGACSSSCERTIAALEWNKYVKRVGENTSGTFHFGNAGIAILPYSKIKVVIPTQYNEYYDHRFIERVGLVPDIKVPQGQDAYETAKKLILHK